MVRDIDACGGRHTQHSNHELDIDKYDGVFLFFGQRRRALLESADKDESTGAATAKKRGDLTGFLIAHRGGEETWCVRVERSADAGSTQWNLHACGQEVCMAEKADSESLPCPRPGSPPESDAATTSRKTAGVRSHALKLAHTGTMQTSRAQRMRRAHPSVGDGVPFTRKPFEGVRERGNFLFRALEAAWNG